MNNRYMSNNNTDRNATWRVGVYCRLSKDDELTGESASISNQRDILVNYCQSQGWQVVKKIALHEMKRVEDLDKVIRNEKVYQSGKVGTGGYYVTFNDSIDIPAAALYEEGCRIPLKIDDFKTFVEKNILDTTQSCNLLGCSRQNLAYLVNQKCLTSVKEEVRGNLYMKGDVLRNMW